MKRHDLILVGALLVVSALLFLITYIYGQENHGGSVEVVIDGELKSTLPLSKDTEIRYETGDGHYNVLVIKDGKTDIIEADCRDGICVKHAPVSAPGETIVCLPHKFVVTVVRE